MDSHKLTRMFAFLFNEVEMFSSFSVGMESTCCGRPLFQELGYVLFNGTDCVTDNVELLAWERVVTLVPLDLQWIWKILWRQRCGAKVF